MKHLHTPPTLPLNRDAAACGRLGNFPGSTRHGLPGSFIHQSPLASRGPGPAPFWAGWGQEIRRIWPDWRAFMGDLIGALCVIALPFSLLFLEFVK